MLEIVPSGLCTITGNDQANDYTYEPLAKSDVEVDILTVGGYDGLL